MKYLILATAIFLSPQLSWAQTSTSSVSDEMTDVCQLNVDLFKAAQTAKAIADYRLRQLRDCGEENVRLNYTIEAYKQAEFLPPETSYGLSGWPLVIVLLGVSGLGALVGIAL